MNPLFVRSCVFLGLAAASMTTAQTWQVRNPTSSQNLVESDHFVVRWNNTDGVTLTKAQIQAQMLKYEGYWKTYIDSMKWKEPFLGQTTKYKIDVYLAANNYYGSNSGTALWVNLDGFKWAVAHEFAHVLQYTSGGFQNSEYVGTMWESHAEFMNSHVSSGTEFLYESINAPNLHFGNSLTRYGGWGFLEHLQDAHGIATVNGMWEGACKVSSCQATEEPMKALMRTKSWSQAQLNDEFGKYAMRNVNWDYQRGAMFRRDLGDYSDLSWDRRGRVAILQTLDSAQRRFQIPHWWAPQRWGYNLVRLYPDAGATSVTVNFQGVVQTKSTIASFESGITNVPAKVPAPASGWRWGVVAVGSDGVSRQSALQSTNSGSLTVPVKSTDKSLWMMVVGAPTTHESIRWGQSFHSIYRFPWLAQFTNAWPEGYQANANKAPSVTGARHANGGGFVAATAKVDATAFVGANAMVLGTAKVLGNARIEDYARVEGAAVVQNSAIVRGRAKVLENAVVSGSAIVEDAARIYGSSQVYDNARVNRLTVLAGTSKVFNTAVIGSVGGFYIDGKTVSGTAQVLGDVSLSTNVSKGVFYGEIGTDEIKQVGLGLNRTTAPTEVTLQPPYSWTGTTVVQNQGTLTSKALDTVRMIGRMELTGIAGYSVQRVEFWKNGVLKCTDATAPFQCLDTVAVAGTTPYQAKVFVTGQTAVAYTVNGNFVMPFAYGIRPRPTPNELYVYVNLPAGGASSVKLNVTRIGAGAWNQTYTAVPAGTNRLKFGVKFAKKYKGTFVVQVIVGTKTLPAVGFTIAN